MDDILRVLQRAGRRLSLNTYLNQLHWWAIGVAALACFVALLTRGLPAVENAIGWVWFAPVLIGTALLGALSLWVKRRPTTLHVAITVDDRLALREKISTAMLCRGRDDGFSQAAVDDAINVARDPKTQERVNRTFPIVAPQRWWISPAIVSAAALITILVPSMDLFANAENEITKEDRQKIQTIQKDVQDKTIEILEQTGMTPDEIKKFLDGEKGTDLDTPGDKEEPKTPEQAKKDAFEDLTRVQDKLLREQSEDEKTQALSELSNRLNELDLENQDGPAADLGAALKAGNFNKAKKALQKLQEQLKAGDLNKEQKEALAKQLQQMAEKMDQLAKQSKKMEDALKQAGMDPNLANNPQALKQALKDNKNLTPQQKKQLQQMAQAQQQAGQMMKKMAGATQQMAKGIPGMPGQGQPGQNPGQGMGEMLSQMEMTQQKMNAMQNALDKLAGECNGMGKGLGGSKPGGLSQSDAMAQWQMMMQQQNNGSGPGMGNRGRGSGGRAQRQQTKGNTTPDQIKVQQQQGPIIGETFIDSDGQIKGESQAGFAQVTQTATNRNNQDLEENKISVKHEDAVKHYFGELKALAESTNAETVTTEDTTEATDPETAEDGN